MLKYRFSNFDLCLVCLSLQRKHFLRFVDIRATNNEFPADTFSGEEARISP